MNRLLTLEGFTHDELNHVASGYCKWFQRIQMRSLCAQYHAMANFCEIGAHDYFTIINEYPGPKFLVDPYNGAAGAGLGNVPPNLPYPVVVFRCLLGVDSALIPSDLLDFCFSVSVIEHIGQVEVNYDCQPTEEPPQAQEMPRDAFCRELFRIMRPGGITIHSVDHAARNRSYIKNFIDAGFKPLLVEPVPSVEDCLHQENAVRQRHAWLDRTQPMTEEEMQLHGVLTLGFRKPTRSD